MKLNSLAINYDNGIIRVLDQQKLPQQENWIECKSIADMCACIKDLKVRGAPLIGVAAMLALAQVSQAGATKDEIITAAKQLIQTRPTAVNLQNYMNYLFEHMNPEAANVSEIAEKLFHEDIELCKKIATNGVELISEPETVMTYCNTGGLATVGCGTALAIIKKGYNVGKIKHVYVCETRPLLQGGRLTAWELEQAHIPYTLICDNMAAFLMQQGKVDRVFTGADRIAVNGDTANKIGTYNLAVLAKYHNIPFHIAAPHTTFDASCASGNDIKIEERNPDEVRGAIKYAQWAPENANVYNPSFDITPGNMINSFVLDSGVFTSINLETLLQI